jgi:hypothetical protein
LEKPLNRAELDVLEVLRQHHAQHGPVERTVLSVEARGRGLEFGRALARLITLGLAEEFTRKPFFLKRLFGAKPVVLLRPTAAGFAEGLSPQKDTAAEPEDLAAPITDPVTDPASSEAPTPKARLNDTAATAASTSAPASEPAPTVEPTAPTEPALATVPLEPALSPDAPLLFPDANESVSTAPQPEQTVPAKAAKAPEPAPEATQPKPAAKPKPAKAKPRPKPITAFTEDLGGAPLPLAAPALPASVDPATLEGLRESLSVMGLDLTPAGEALAAHRIAKGATPAEALSQVVLYAFAHAVQQDLYSGGPVADLGLRDYATEVLREIAKLCAAGELDEAAFDRDKRQLWAVLDEGLDREANVKILLCDPMGGSAPPAVLPEDLRRSDDE